MCNFRVRDLEPFAVSQILSDLFVQIQILWAENEAEIIFDVFF